MQSYGKDIKTVKLLYFSGTGNTAAIADCFEDILVQKGLNVCKHNICEKSNNTVGEDLSIIIYPVYAFDIPIFILKRLESMQTVNNVPAVIISNSGGGEVTPNTACRVSCTKELQKKGYDVVYEKMIVMPSNWVTATPEPMAVKLLEVLPANVEKIVNDLLMGVRRRTKPNFIDRIMPFIGKGEVTQAKKFGRKIKVNGRCTGCGLCAKECPSNNISMENGKPVFSDKCFLCGRCIYGCPAKALEPGTMKFVILKDGYSLKKLQSKVPYTGEFHLDSLADKKVFAGIKKYLVESGIQ